MIHASPAIRPFAVMGCLLLAACSPPEPQQPTTQPGPPADTQATKANHEWIGSISSVDRQQGYVLIRTQLSLSLHAGTVLTSASPDGAGTRSANLLVTGEALGNFAAADIQSGEVEVGDGVYRIQWNKDSANPSVNGTEKADNQ